VVIEDTLQKIAAEISECKLCPLSLGRKNSVPGEGPADADIMFIGEGPGFHENEQGRPFVGQAGKFLDELLASANLSRNKVFITNVVKCRPPGNRDPQSTELEACRNYLERQIATINPKVVVTLGRHSIARYFKDAKISVIHGQAAWFNGQLVVAMYHPAAGLHQPSLKEVIRKDFNQLLSLVEKAQKTGRNHVSHSAHADTNDQEDATQLSFF